MNKKAVGVTLLVVVYVLTACIGGLLFWLFATYVPAIPLIVNILICDVICTIYVYLMGLIFKTPSIYDPYWSTQTVVIYLGLLIYFNNFNLFTIIPLVAIGLYSIRLFANFIIGFHDLTYIDWRYRMLASKSGKLFQVVNLLGIHMFPTLVVYLVSVPLMVYATLTDFSYLDFIGSGIIVLATILELISDIQMKKFIKNRTSKEEVINIGLWKYSRHPNYLGEIIIWFGVALVLIVAHYSYWYWIVGAVVNLWMFLFISIPMEEKHMMQYKPNLGEYIMTTSMLLLLPKRKNKKTESKDKE